MWGLWFLSAEKRATGALITYYAHTLEAPFGEVVQSVKAFARADADRLALRGRLRAQAIKPLTWHGADIYVGGWVHPLFPVLLPEKGPRWWPKDPRGIPACA